MRSYIFNTIVTSALFISSSVNALLILVTNDDGFGTANIREMYKAIKAKGHTAYIVASTSNESGTGGTVIYTTTQNLTSDTEFGIVKAGSPSVGTDPNDNHIWYYNGTPSACVQVALDYIFPSLNLPAPDLVMSGPNYGLNLGPFLYTLSGTIGATYTAVERGVPGIAFSGGTTTQTPYYYLNTTTPAGLPDPATIYGELAANLAQQLIDNTESGRLLPPGYGISVNLPYITSYTNSSCINPPFIQTRLTGGAEVGSAIYDNNTGLFSLGYVTSIGANTYINGDSSLPGETQILSSGCQSSVSVFSVDYDAPLTCGNAPDLRTKLLPLVQYANSTKVVGGLNATSTVVGTATGTGVGPTTYSAVISDGKKGISVSWVVGSLSVVAFGLGL